MTAPSPPSCSPQTTEPTPESDPPLFALGDVRITDGASEVLTSEEIRAALHRHQHGDHGELDEESLYLNGRALANCGMVMSVFLTTSGTEYWIQTHGTRSHTLILLPGE